MARGSSPGERRGGRQKGTPNKATQDIKEIAQQYGPAAIKQAAMLAGLIEGGAAESEAARVAALNILLDRGYGKPSQVVGSDPENPLPEAPSRIEHVYINASKHEMGKG